MSRLNGAVYDHDLRVVGRVTATENELVFKLDDPELQKKVDTAMQKEWLARYPIEVPGQPGTLVMGGTRARPHNLATLPHAKTMLASLRLFIGDVQWKKED